MKIQLLPLRKHHKYCVKDNLLWTRKAEYALSDIKTSYTCILRPVCNQHSYNLHSQDYLHPTSIQGDSEVTGKQIVYY